MLEKLLQSDWVPALVLAVNAEMPNRCLDESCALGEVSGVKCLCAPRTVQTVVNELLLNAGVAHQVIAAKLHWSINNSLADDADHIQSWYI